MSVYRNFGECGRDRKMFKKEGEREGRDRQLQAENKIVLFKEL